MKGDVVIGLLIYDKMEKLTEKLNELEKSKDELMRAPHTHAKAIGAIERERKSAQRGIDELSKQKYQEI